MNPSPGRLLALAAVLFGPAPGSAGPRLDFHGDPLPDGAVARLGSVRLRHAGLSDFALLDGGKRAVTAGSDRVLRFWDLGSGRQLRSTRLQGRAGPGTVLAFSPDGKALAADTEDKVVLWDVDSGKEARTWPKPKAGVAFLCFAPDGKTLAVGAWDWRVALRNLATGEERTLSYPTRAVGADSTYHAHFAPDGKRFVVGGGWLSPLCVFEMATGREAHRLDCTASASAVSPDGKRLAVASMQNDRGARKTVLRLFDLASGKEAAQFSQGHDDWYFSLAFSPDGKSLACGSSDHCCVLDCASGRVRYRLDGRPWGLTFSPDGKALVANSGRRLLVWDAATGKGRHDWPGEFDWGVALAGSPDGRLVAAADWMVPTVSAWEAHSGRLVREFPLTTKTPRSVQDVAFSDGGHTLVAGRYDGTLQFWDVVTGQERRAIRLDDPDHPDRTYVCFQRLRLTPDGRRVHTLERQRQGVPTRVAVWDAVTPKLLAQHPLPGGVNNCAWSADASSVALPFKDGLLVMDVRTGAGRFRVAGVDGKLPPAYSPDGRLLAARREEGGKPAKVGVWEVATGQEVVTVATGPVGHLALAPDDRSLVTTENGHLRVWDLATGRERRRWPLPAALNDPAGEIFAYGLSLSPDGRRAFTAMADGTALVWDVSAGLRPAAPLTGRPSEQAVAGWWADLAAADAGRAYAAVWRLTEAPAAVAYLRRHLRPAGDADRKEVRQLIAALDSDSFAAREKAARQLEGLGSAAVPALREALAAKPSPEVRRRLEALLSRAPHAAPPAEVVRKLRAILVLEQVASEKARGLLAELAEGVPSAAETQEAKAALGRLTRAPGVP